MKFILLHGSWHGAWAFDRVVPLLKEQGHEVDCTDLPGSGQDAARAPEITFDDLTNHVIRKIEASTEPAVIVAHSFAGFMAAIACEKVHHKVKHVFYVAGWLPTEGKSIIDLAIAYNKSDLPGAFIAHSNPKLRAVDKEVSKGVFYNDCSAEDQTWAALQLKPKALEPDLHKMPRVEPVHCLSKSTYLLCKLDRVVAPSSQLDMATRFGFKKTQIKRLASGHSPFLSKPRELAKILLSSE